MRMKQYVLRMTLAFLFTFVCCSTVIAGNSSQKPLETLSLSALQPLLATNKGKVVVINFFATWCPPCREEIPGLINIRQSFSRDKVLLIGASLDEDEDALYTYMEATKFPYPIMKAGFDLLGAAGVQGIPHLLIFDAKGEVAANQGGLVSEADLRAFLERVLEGK